jgi:hypothetical protein
MEFEFRASQFLGRCSTTWAMPPAENGSLKYTINYNNILLFTINFHKMSSMLLKLVH